MRGSAELRAQLSYKAYLLRVVRLFWNFDVSLRSRLEEAFGGQSVVLQRKERESMR